MTWILRCPCSSARTAPAAPATPPAKAGQPPGSRSGTSGWSPNASRSAASARPAFSPRCRAGRRVPGRPRDAQRDRPARQPGATVGSAHLDSGAVLLEPPACCGSREAGLVRARHLWQSDLWHSDLWRSGVRAGWLPRRRRSSSSPPRRDRHRSRPRSGGRGQPARRGAGLLARPQHHINDLSLGSCLVHEVQHGGFEGALGWRARWVSPGAELPRVAHPHAGSGRLSQTVRHRHGHRRRQIGRQPVQPLGAGMAGHRGLAGVQQRRPHPGQVRQRTVEGGVDTGMHPAPASPERSVELHHRMGMWSSGDPKSIRSGRSDAAPCLQAQSWPSSAASASSSVPA